jgi:hypothetical protein
MALLDWANGDLFSALRDKFNAVRVAVSSFAGGTTGQIWTKSSGTDFAGSYVDFETLFPTKVGKAKDVYRVNAAETAVEYVKFIDCGYLEINSARTESTGTPHIDTEATIFSIATPNDGVTRDYHIILTSVIDASTGSSFGYNSYFKIASSYLSSNVAEIPTGSRISYTHNAILSSVPPNTTILIRDKRSASTTGTVNTSKLTYVGYAN